MGRRKRMLNVSKRISANKKRIHDKTVDELVDRLLMTKDHNGDRLYDVVVQNWEYQNPYNQEYGEIDVYVAHKDTIIKFEVKCHDSYKLRKKMIDQLGRSTRYFEETAGYRRLLSFYVTPKIMRKIET